MMEESSSNAVWAVEQPGDSSLSIPSPQPLRMERKEKICLILIFVFAVFFVILTGQKRYGLSWDEAYYYEPSRSAARWLGRALFSGARPLSSDEIDAAWEEIRELPSFVKLALGTSSLLFENVLGQLTALRLPAAIAFALTLLLIYRLMIEHFGRRAAVAGTLAYALTPPLFGHAHIGASESFTAFMTILTVFCFLKGLEKPLWSVLLGIVFGLALNTKINCAFLPLVLLPWAHVYHRRKYANNFFALVFLSPVAMVITWPWLWHDTAKRLLEYFYFFVSHQFTAVYYFGQKYNYGSALAPWHYPFVMMFYNTPPLILFFMFAGIASALKNIRRSPVEALLLWGGIFTLGIAAMPNSPKYDGVRLFLPAFVFMLPLAGVGLAALCERLPFDELKKQKAAVLSIVLIGASGLFSVITSFPYNLTYFNIFAGGIRGAWNKGMETTWWGEAVNDGVLKALNELPKGARIKTLALHEKVFEYHQTWGNLRADLQINRGAPPYDYHLLLVRKGFFARPEWCLFLTWRRLKVFEHLGVPMVMLFKTGADFEAAWHKTALGGNVGEQNK
ncbi:MAG TPA: glycosyltransferase family 39 protein [Candidatus Sumerlaeota bacterium]|nr:MAG: hypothetical protein BWY12_00332 [candidate division BRC1 bacterium ADurb.Bin183]HOE62147.1 glycosyltransferase family 39 protein [Candidatus Sumerlaeota bacterium]HRR30212.1 glycosyltransferase family 39 protein [Candidatus Sumerlaeia bacterium]HON49062.1 glycosyltransferase family 39 protein [Candidatus Sumerlaeota bacterium]HOR64331.1 glycosyltransferase family 39 protein [Candidatus Sumerlaeota bacterium]